MNDYIYTEPCVCGTCANRDKLKGQGTNAVNLYPCNHCTRRLAGIVGDHYTKSAYDMVAECSNCHQKYGYNVSTLGSIPPPFICSFCNHVIVDGWVKYNNDRQMP